jgi:signal transduction histidine kinase
MLEVAASADRDAGVCRVQISDSGAGIPPDQIQRIFEPFVTTKPRGTGLGLAVTRRIVREHGGTVVADNRPGGGAVFTVELRGAAGADLALPLKSLAAAVTAREHETPIAASSVH